MSAEQLEAMAAYDQWTLAPRWGLRPNPIHARALTMYREFLHRVSERDEQS